ncbi:aryl-sulfate sulfotransferase [bacterium]|nr:aryl-sulfate sulfotransferase [bacterium]
MKTFHSPSRARLFLVISSAVVITGVLLLCAALFTRDTRPDEWQGRIGKSATPLNTWRAKIQEPATPPGGWRTARDSHLTSEHRTELNGLESLGYLAGGARGPSQSGVTLHDDSRSWHGLNLYVSGDSPGATLIDMEGNVVHEWHYPFDVAWPDRQEEYETERGARYWFHAHLFENGDIIGIFNGLGLVKLDKSSNLLWKFTGGSHHHLHVADDGRIYVITRRERADIRISTGTNVLEDAITVLDTNGKRLAHISLVDAFWDSDYASWLATAPINRARKKIDVLHANRIVALDGRLEEHIPSFREGNFLVSLRNFNALVVLDIEREQIVWTMSGMWMQQHCPSVLDNGKILLFDNQGDHGSSRIVEFDPVTQEIEWLYAGDEENGFYSEKFGTVQRLPNGNSLIAESHFGRALEVTSLGDIVWEYYNPARAGDSNEFIANLFEIERLPQDFPTDWLN